MLRGVLVATTKTTLVLLLGAALIGCTPSAPVPSSRSTGGDARQADVPRTLTIGQLNAVKGFSSEAFANTAGGGASLAEIHVNGLVTNDRFGELEPRLVARLPSLDQGTVTILPDGRMETTWRLRPDVKWHDGVPLTSEDVAFSWRAATDPEIPVSGSAEVVNRLIEAIETPDPLTAVIRWKTSYFRALELGHRELWLLPKHLLGEAFEGDKNVFLTLPYWTRDYVQLGPFRLVDFGLGEHMVFERFDDYFLGRPRLSRIIIRSISDPNTLMANLSAGAIDMVSEKTLPLDLFLQMSGEWNETGVGTVVQRQDFWRYLRFQFDPQLAQPVEVSRDVRLRRGLLYGFDRDALREFLLPGVPDTSGDTFMLSGDLRRELVGQPFARYRYDPTQALRDFGEGGWRRAADGRMVSSQGQQVQIEIRANRESAREIALVADFWRRLGLDVSELTPAPALARDPEWQSKFPALESTARGTGDQIFTTFDGRLPSTAENRWTGANRAHYANPALDRLIDRLHATLPQREQGLVLREMGELLATDLPALPLYFAPAFAAMNRGVRALVDDYAGTRGPASGPGLMSRNAHLWDRD